MNRTARPLLALAAATFAIGLAFLFVTSRAHAAVSTNPIDCGYDDGRPTMCRVDIGAGMALDVDSRDMVPGSLPGQFFAIGDLASTTEDDWQQMLAVNQTGVFLGMKTVAPQMKEQGSGSIVNISSIAGLRGTGAAFAYGATKWAVRGMTKSAAQELGPFGVRVNSIHPGIIETPMLELLGGDGASLTERTPLGRSADAEEVAKLALFLASDESSYSTGSEFVIDGGWTAMS